MASHKNIAKSTIIKRPSPTTENIEDSAEEDSQSPVSNNDNLTTDNSDSAMQKKADAPNSRTNI